MHSLLYPVAYTLDKRTIFSGQIYHRGNYCQVSGGEIMWIYITAAYSSFKDTTSQSLHNSFHIRECSVYTASYISLATEKMTTLEFVERSWFTSDDGWSQLSTWLGLKALVWAQLRAEASKLLRAPPPWLARCLGITRMRWTWELKDPPFCSTVSASLLVLQVRPPWWEQQRGVTLLRSLWKEISFLALTRYSNWEWFPF